MHYIFWNNYITSHWPLNQVQKYQTIVVYCKCFQVPSVLAHSRLPGVFCTCCSFTGRNHYRDWSIINTRLAGVTNQLSQEDPCKNYLTVTNTFKYSKWENACHINHQIYTLKRILRSEINACEAVKVPISVDIFFAQTFSDCFTLCWRCEFLVSVSHFPWDG